MAHDFMFGDTASDWARGEFDSLDGNIFDPSFKRQAALTASQVPWGKIGLTIGLTLGGIFLLSKTKHKVEARTERAKHRDFGTRTMEVRPLSSRELMFGKQF